jgi:hypothetical protein
MLGHGAMFVIPQPGAGMHYAVPRVLADAAALQSFCTDISASPPHAPAGSHAKSMGGRLLAAIRQACANPQAISPVVST